MIERAQNKGNREFMREEKSGADYYLGIKEERSGGKPEGDAPYKLEPNATEIETFLTRLREEGL